jgi:hypothetical protein
VPFWDADFSGPRSRGWDPVCEVAVDEEFLIARAGKGKGVLVVDKKKMRY